MPKQPKAHSEKTGTADKSIPEMKVPVGEGERRVPVYLLLDTSGSMAGAPIESVRRGVEQFKQEIEEDTFAKETVAVGVITFGGEADFITRGLIPFDNWKPPYLSAGGETPLGQAFFLLTESLDKDVRSAVKGGQRGDWKPLVFILTDGAPTDEWQEPREEILKREMKKVVNIITVGCGPRLDRAKLKEIGLGSIFCMSDDDRSFGKFFEWVTQSVIAASRATSQPGGSDKPMSQPPPDDIQFIP